MINYLYETLKRELFFLKKEENLTIIQEITLTCHIYDKSNFSISQST